MTATACIHVPTLLALMTFTAAAADWQLVWSDEFDYQGLPDPHRWGYETGYVRNNEAQYYTPGRSGNARVEGGELIIEARRDNWEGHEYTSASLTTRGKAAWTYGRIEARIKIPTGNGMWPAFWTLGTNIGEVGWATCGEIDILENVGFDPNRVYGNIHTEAYNHSIGTGKGHSIVVEEPYNRYYTYAIEWYGDRIDFFVDSVKHFTFENEETGEAAWPFDKDQYLILNVAVGGSWGGQQGIDTTIFPQRMYVDYVRVYQRSYPGPYSLSTHTSGAGTVSVSPRESEYDSGTTVTLEATPDQDYEFVGWSGDAYGTDNPLTVTMTRDVSITARFARPGEMVSNGSFDEGMTGWYSWTDPNSSVESDGKVVDGSYTVTVSAPGSNDWQAQIGHGDIPMVEGKRYRVTFDASADQPTVLSAAVRMNRDPYTTYWSTTLDLTTTPQTYAFEFTMAEADDPDSRVEFDFGLSSGTITIDNVSMVCLDDLTREAPGSPRPLSAPRGSRDMLRDTHRYDLAGRRTPVKCPASGIMLFDRTFRRMNPPLYRQLK